ncbi:MAG: inositol monophosphatase family protein [bacterium]
MDDNIAYQAQLARLADAASFVVRSVGRWLRQQRESITEDRVEMKQPGDFVTEKDRVADARLREELLAILPGSGILSEEDKPIKGDGRWRWIVNPLDGTTNYLAGLPHWAVSVALEDRSGTRSSWGELVFGIIYLPVLDRLYLARKGHGAKCNGKLIHLGKPRLQRRSTISHWWPMSTGKTMTGFLQIIGNLHGRVGGIRNIGSPASELALVAHGEMDGFFATDTEPTDLAAGILLLQEAGGVIGDPWGHDPLDSGWIIAASEPIHELLRKEIREVFRTAPKKRDKS